MHEDIPVLVAGIAGLGQMIIFLEAGIAETELIIRFPKAGIVAVA